ncbi:hypothetical protein N1937_05215 [Rhizobium sp. WSM4643]|uniref:hypothetical protein n=1 Tax=Rhizobium sp. WSM4643 TaxID=3138253 RepID=UPI0021A65D87|nr:hypothetical protein [Rhizobium leguminosarum]UWM76640.1 hypothetical protein N1937_05215 [Rhizobium leguminosarum bv. viciae]
MTMIDERTPITREGITADLRRLADLAEASGDRVSAVRALKLAWSIERRCRTDLVAAERENSTLH